MAYTAQDKFAKRAKERGYRARSAFKLLDLQRKFKIFKKDQKVLDLGAAPGSWLQVAAPLVGENGKVIGIDIALIEPLNFAWVEVFQKDIVDKDIVEFLKKQEPKLFNVVISDVAPNTTGIKERDQGLSHELSLRVLEIAREVLRSGGGMVVKVFEGAETPQLISETKRYFQNVKLIKPEASQKGSKEFYLVAQRFKK